jgi:ribosomal protein S18 acetylase RimI-like enzyme
MKRYSKSPDCPNMAKTTSGMQVSIRTFQATDLASILNIQRESFTKEFCWSKREVQRFIRDPRTTCVVARSGDLLTSSIVGYCMYRHAGRAVQVWDIAVSPCHRRKGIGKALITYVWRVMVGGRLRQRRVVCVVAADPSGTMRFFRHMGFRAVGVIDDGCRPGVDAFTMSAEPERQVEYINRISRYYNAITQEY